MFGIITVVGASPVWAAGWLSQSMSLSSAIWEMGLGCLMVLFLFFILVIGYKGISYLRSRMKTLNSEKKTLQSKNSEISTKNTTNETGFPVLDQPMTRRSFISVLGLGWATFAAASLGAFAGFVRFLFPQVTFEPNPVFEAGLPSEFTIGVHSQFKLNKKVFLVRDHSGFYALSSICTHLGCIPNWLPSEQIFKCPCHGSGYYISGINFEGPAPRPLPRYEITLASNGKIRVNKSHQYLYELHQWGLPGSFLDYAG